MLKVKIISQTKKIYEGKAKKLRAPGAKGHLGIYPKHANLISTLKIGKIDLDEEDGDKKTILINGGILKVQNDKVMILTNEATPDDEIIKEEIDKAIKEAQKKISSELPKSELIQLEKQIRYEKLKKKVSDSLG